MSTKALYPFLLLLGLAAVGCTSGGESEDSTTLAPSVTSINPNYGSLSGRTTVTLSGTGFSSGLRVSMGGSACRPTSISATEVVCITSSHAVGTVDTVVTNPNDLSSTLAGSFVYTPAMTVSSVSPAEGPAQGGIPIVVTGTYFPDAFTIKVGSNPCTSPSQTSATTVTCTLGAGTVGVASVVVTGADNQIGTLTNAFTYRNAPFPVSLNPASGPLAGETFVTITGVGFNAGATVTIGGGTCTGVTVNSSTSLTCTTPAGSLGAQTVTVTNPDLQAASLASGFTYLANDTLSQLELVMGALSPIGAVDGTGASARFNNPSGTWLEGTDLYIADCNNHAIRRLDTLTGAVTTFAGLMGSAGSTDATGTAARFNCPRNLTAAGSFFYVSDQGNHTIRRIDKATAAVTLFAGTAGAAAAANGVGTAARFNTPEGIWSDGTNLFVADAVNHSIRQIVIATANVTTLAGTLTASGAVNGVGAAARFNTPYGITGDGTYLYVADYSNHAIRRVDIATGTVTTHVGVMGAAGAVDGVGAAARLNGPIALSYDGTHVWVAEYGASRIRRFDPAGAGLVAVAGAYGLGGAADATGLSSRFTNPRGIYSNGTHVWIGDMGNRNIRRYTIATGVVQTIAGVPDTWGYSDGNASIARFNLPYFLATYAGELLVADRNNCAIRAITLDSRVSSTPAGLPGTCALVDSLGSEARFNLPTGLLRIGGDLYITEEGGHTIRKMDIVSRSVSTIAGSYGVAGSTDATGVSALFSSPRGMANDASYLYVADRGNHTIRRIDLITAAVTTLAGLAGAAGSTNAVGTSARFNNPYDLTLVGTDLFVADCSNHLIRRIDTLTANVTSFAGGGGYADGFGVASARFNCPISLTNDGTNLYIADTNNHSIRKAVIASGLVTTLIGAGPSFSYDTGPTGVFSTTYVRLPASVVWTGSGLFFSNTYGIYRAY